jgi:RNA polymerase sigma-70 factor (ECF subfamily)
VSDTPHDLTSVHVQRAAAGDVASRTFLVERFTPLLMAQARYRLFGAAARHCEPEDLVQEVWAITLPRLPDLRDRDGRWTPVLVKFLATTLLRCVNHVLRKHVVGRPATDSSSVEALPADLSGVVTRLCRRDHIDAVQAAIAALPPEEREVLVLRGIEQHGNREVAAMLGVDDSVVTRRWQKALANLRGALPDSVLVELE